MEQYLNNTCFIYPRAKIPNGLYLTYDSCPERYDNHTPKLVKYCCFIIIYEITQSSNYKIAQDFLRDYSSTLLLLPAILFNILSLVVLNRLSKTRVKTSTTVYMKYLCTLDMLTIVSKFFHEIVVVRNAVRENPILITSFMCKFINFFESACTISSIYLLIAMSIDKLVCVLMPLKVSQLLTPMKAKQIFSCIILLSSLFSCYELFAQHAVELRVTSIKSSSKNSSVGQDKPNKLSHMSHLINTNNNYSFVGYDCDSKWPERYKDWLLINNIIKVFLPILLLCVCNSWIVIALAKSHQKTKLLFNEPDAFKLKSVENSKAKQSAPCVCDELLQHNESHMNEKQVEKNTEARLSFINLKRTTTKKKRRNTTQHISIMLFAISFGFVLLNLPYAVKTIFHRHFSKNNKISSYLYHSENLFLASYTKSEIINSVKYEFYSNMTHLLLDLNYIANFFLYFLSGQRFRAQLLGMLKCKWNKEGKQVITQSNINRVDNNNNNNNNPT